MRKSVRKLFFPWNFDKEEKWLNEMAAKGFALVSVGYCRYEFEDCIPGEYNVCIDFLEKKQGSIETMKYIEFVEETGAEHVGSYMGWAYFRKKNDGQGFSMFSDNGSRVRYITRIIRFIAAIYGLNLWLGLYNLFLYFLWGNTISLVGVINIVIFIIGAIGIIRLLGKRKKLKAEQQIFE